MRWRAGSLSPRSAPDRPVQTDDRPAGSSPRAHPELASRTGSARQASANAQSPRACRGLSASRAGRVAGRARSSPDGARRPTRPAPRGSRRSPDPQPVRRPDRLERCLSPCAARHRRRTAVRERPAGPRQRSRLCSAAEFPGSRRRPARWRPGPGPWVLTRAASMWRRACRWRASEARSAFSVTSPETTASK